MLAITLPEEAAKLNQRVVDLLSPDYRDWDTDVRDLDRLLKAARATDHDDLAQKVDREIQHRRRVLANASELYSEDHLAASYANRQQLITEK